MKPSVAECQAGECQDEGNPGEDPAGEGSQGKGGEGEEGEESQAEGHSGHDHRSVSMDRLPSKQSCSVLCLFLVLEKSPWCSDGGSESNGD